MSSEDDQVKSVETKIGHKDDSLSTASSINMEQTTDSSNGKDESVIQIDIGAQQRMHSEHSQDPNLIKATLETILKTNADSKSLPPQQDDYLEELDDDQIVDEEFGDDDEDDEDDDNEDDDDDEDVDDEIETDDEFNNLWYESCVNENPHCDSLAAAGKCIPPEDYDEDDPDLEDSETVIYEFMRMHCAPACQACDALLEYEERVLDGCHADRSTDIFQPGDLDRMFERIVEEAKDENVPYTVNILSRPMDNSSIVEVENGNNPQYYNGPWILKIDNFITDEECDRLIQLGGIEEYEPSGLAEEDRLTDEEWEDALKKENRPRTSSNAWCQYECYEDPLAKRVISKIEKLTGIPDNYQEWLQLVKYVPGQYYKMHHDNGYETMRGPQGPRLLTVFIYLNDVEEGGATRFNDIFGDKTMVHMDVLPRKGSALIWPSVLSEFPNDTYDKRTFHEAMMVTKGVKFGANAWLHLRDYKNSIGDCDLDEFERVMTKRGISV